MITICTVLNGKKYSYDHVNKLYNSLKANTIIDFKFVCYTDYPKNGFDKGIIIIPIEHDLKKLQWYKTDFFKSDFLIKHKINDPTDFNNTTVVMDIDLDIVGKVDFLFDPFPHQNFLCSHRWWWTRAAWCARPRTHRTADLSRCRGPTAGRRSKCSSTRLFRSAPPTWTRTGPGRRRRCESR